MQNLQSLEIIILAASAAYFLGLAGFLPGLRSGLRRKNDFPLPILPSVTILVCARNEEKNVDICLRSMMKIDYPPNLLEILVVDDRSSDATASILDSWKNKIPNLRTISIKESDEIEFQGKINA